MNPGILRWTILLLIQALFLSGAALATSLDAGDERYVLGSAEVDYLRDPEGRLVIDDVASPAPVDNFRPLAHGISFGYTQDVIWLRITLQRAPGAPADWQLELNSPFLNDVRFHVPDGAGFKVAQGGDQFPFSERLLPYSNPVFPVFLPDGGRRVFYLRLQTDSIMAAQLVLWQPQALRKTDQRELFLIGGASGLILMTGLISLASWLLTRDRMHVCFAGFSGILLLSVVANEGLLARFVFPHTPAVPDLLVPWSFGAAVAATLLVFRWPLKIPGRFPRVDLGLRAGALISLLAPLSREVDLYTWLGGPIIHAALLIGLTVLYWAAWQGWRRHQDGAGFVLAGLLCAGSAMLCRLLIFLGVFPPYDWIGQNGFASVLVFLLVIQAGTIVESRRKERMRYAADQQAEVSAKLASQECRLREEQNVYFSLVAHELRTPLAVIVACQRNLEQKLAGKDEMTQARLARMGQATRRIAGLVESHLQWQRLAGGKFKLNLESVSPQDVAAEALQHVRAAFPQRAFEQAATGWLPAVVPVDPELACLALGNLLSNAAKYSPAHEPVRLEVVADAALHYRVVDGGEGIAVEDVERVFSLFHRSPSAADKDGFGIGLATARRIAELHGGRLDYTREEARTVFTLTLPLMAMSGGRPA